MYRLFRLRNKIISDKIVEKMETHIWVQ